MVKKEPSLHFLIQGHTNTLSTHKNTVEFTKDEHLTKRGDCILGVNANFDFSTSDIKLLKKKKIGFLLEANQKEFCDYFSAYYNGTFSSKHEMVIRKSDFNEDTRTFAIKSNKAAIDINRKLMKYLQKEIHSATITIAPIPIKNIVFDFDNTLEDWTSAEDKADKKLAKMALDECKKQGKINLKFTVDNFLKFYTKVKHKYVSKSPNPKNYGRDVWLKDIFKEFKVNVTKADIERYVNFYWKDIDKNVKLFSGTLDVLKELHKQKYRMFIYSDSDGTKEIKMRRIHLFHIEKYFEGIYTSDDTGYNKPSVKGESMMISDANINPHETVFVGDHPESDHLGSKKLGMSTVWIKKGHWAEREDKLNYVDFEIKRIKQLMPILKRLN